MAMTAMVRPMQVRAVDVGADVIMTGMDDVRASQPIAGHLKQRARGNASVIAVERGGGRHHERQADKANQGEDRSPPSHCRRLQDVFRQGPQRKGAKAEQKRMNSLRRPTPGTRRSATQGRDPAPQANCCQRHHVANMPDPRREIKPDGGFRPATWRCIQPAPWAECPVTRRARRETPPPPPSPPPSCLPLAALAKPVAAGAAKFYPNPTPHCSRARLRAFRHGRGRPPARRCGLWGERS